MVEAAGSSRASCPTLHLHIHVQWNLTRARLGSHPIHINQIKKPPQGWFVYLVEAAGIEPASASDSLSALHAYPSY
jgi:hypothetical protein